MVGRLDFQELEKQNLLSILLYLYRVGRTKKTALYDNVSRTNTMPQKVERLQEMGLINEIWDTFDNNTKYIELTPLGYRVAKRLQDIEDLMNGLEPEADRTDHGAPETEVDHARP